MNDSRDYGQKSPGALDREGYIVSLSIGQKGQDGSNYFFNEYGNKHPQDEGISSIIKQLSNNSFKRHHN